MASITVKFKDGTKREFPHEGRAGGIYPKTVKYEGAFVIAARYVLRHYTPKPQPKRAKGRKGR